MQRLRISQLFASDNAEKTVHICGWVRTRRDAKDFSFFEINDGSCRTGIQVIADGSLADFQALRATGTGAALRVLGTLVESPGQGQKWEIQASEIEILGECPEDYPLQKKRHSDEFLRSIAHLRPRTNKYGAMLRIRSRLSFAIHDFLQGRGFHYIHTPIITGSDCEGAGEMFRVSTLDPAHPPKQEGKVDFREDFFGKEAKLTVSGQLSVETCALALSDVYTFGPTFRSENSNTSRHMAEFWMIEPEMAFADLSDDMDLAEAMVRYLVNFVREDCAEDMELFTKFVDKDLSDTLANVGDQQFERLSYTDAIEILANAEQKFEFPVAWGEDLQSEHERFLTETYFRKPVFVYDWPKDIKAFYMRVNDDGRTVAAMDLLVPRIGELVGGSQREERLDVLEKRITELGFNPADYWWYLDTRKFGTAPHAGFGIGFERLLMLVTGISNIRDVIAFPRTPQNLEF